MVSYWQYGSFPEGQIHTQYTALVVFFIFFAQETHEESDGEDDQESYTADDDVDGGEYICNREMENCNTFG